MPQGRQSEIREEGRSPGVRDDPPPLPRGCLATSMSPLDSSYSPPVRPEGGAVTEKGLERLGIWLAEAVPWETVRQGGRKERSWVVPMLKNCTGGSSSPRINTGRNALGFGALVDDTEICDGKRSRLAVHKTKDPD